METILEDWEAFAKSLGAITSRMTSQALRDHAQKMLLGIVADMRVEQSADEQEAKGKGAGPERLQTAASKHGIGRHNDGFSLQQLTAEFRALRASVLRLWLPTIDQTDLTSVNEIIRFNEAIDEAVSDSVSMFTDKTDEARDVFLAMLGHDLRSPLHAIGLTTQYFEREEVETHRRIASAKRIRRGVASMSRMVNDLLEFSRMQLGGRMPIVRSSEDLVEVCQRAVGEARTAHPGCSFRLEAPDEALGEFDADRLEQLFGNLLNNAFQYRARGTRVTMTIELHEHEVVVSVHNFGAEIPLERQDSIFDPLVQLPTQGRDVDRPRSSAGLGLFIARRIAEAHGGRLTVSSTASQGTTFFATLPRQAERKVRMDSFGQT